MNNGKRNRRRWTSTYCLPLVYLFIGLTGCLSLSPALVRAETADVSGLLNYRSETAYIQSTPGVSSSIAAGCFNPAAWSIQKNGGFYFGWRDQAEVTKDKKPWLLAYSNRAMGFAMQRFQYKGLSEASHYDEYTLGVSWGDWAAATGISYSWNRGNDSLSPRHRRLTLGQISRWRLFSLGSITSIDLEKRDHLIQTDLGIRPLGPRITLFGDLLYHRGDDFEDISTGFGLSAMPIPGLSLTGRMVGERNQCDNYNWDYTIGISIGLTQTSRVNGQIGLNNNGDHVSTIYSIESGNHRPSIFHGKFSQGSLYPEFSLRGPMSYQRYRFFDRSNTLLNTLARINHCAENPAVGGVVLNLSGMRIGIEKLWELREQLAGLRAAGKKVVVYFDRAGISSLMLASVADQVWIDPIGEIEIPGICLGRTFYRGALDKAGIGIDELRFFTYKSAVESFSRTSMSGPDREQRQALVDDYYSYLRDTIIKARGISEPLWDSLINTKGILTASDALAAGLVDSIGTFDDMRQQVDTAARRTTGDHSSFTLDGVSGDYLWEPLAWGEPPRIVILYAVGICDMDSGINARLLAQKICDAREDPRVKAVVLRADSPGGSALASDLVARELRLTADDKPVIISQGQLAASGGYWISMYGDRIVASPLSLTGSIGVISMNLWDNGFGDKTGLTFDFVKRGKHADFRHGLRLPLIPASLPARSLTDIERARSEEIIRHLYSQFVEYVAAGRSLTVEEVDRIGQGRIWSGLRGLDLGLVDDLGGLWHAIRLAKQAAGIPPDQHLKIIQEPQLGFFNPGFFTPSFISALARSTFNFIRKGDNSLLPVPDSDQTASAVTSQSVETEFPLLHCTLGLTGISLLSLPELSFLDRMMRSSGSPMVMMNPLSIYSGSNSLLDEEY